ncbi:MAG: DUF1294 domain-containing protein [Methanosarcinaceae archaeon]|nr:DUF1294 domain-containing protein [Methanosarcinaceae archaeon]
MNVNLLSTNYASIYFAFNVISFLFYGFDKAKAQSKRKWRRIPEKNLLLMALMAPFGALAGMQVFRHKIRKDKFKYLVPTFVAVHLIVFAIL